MKHEYIIEFEVWKEGIKVANGNQALTISTKGVEAPAAIELLAEIKKDATEVSKCEPGDVHVVGIFKL